MFCINKNYDTNSRLIPANGPGRVDVDRRFEKSCNYPPLHSHALAVQRFKASGLPLPVLVIMYIYLPTRTHAHTTSARAAAAAVVVLQSYNNSRPPLLQQGVMTFCSESGSSP